MEPRPTYMKRHGIALIAAGVVACALAAASAAEGETARYLGPGTLAVSPDGSTLFVACEDAQEVLWVSLPQGDVVRRVRVPDRPTGLVCMPDGSMLAVACASAKSSVVWLDTATGALVRSAAAGHTAGGLALDERRGQLFVCNRFHNDVSLLDLATGAELARIAAVREPVAAAITPSGRTLLVANHLPDSRVDLDYSGTVSSVVTAIDLRTHESQAIPLPHGASSVRGLCVTPDGEYALVTHLLSNFMNVPFRVDMGWINVNVVSMIDLRQRAVIGMLGLDELTQGAANPWDVAVTADGTQICVTASGSHELCVIDIRHLNNHRARRTMSPLLGAWPIYPSLGASLWRRVALPGKGPRGMVVIGRTAYVSQYYSDSLAAVDLSGSAGSVPREIPLGPPPVLTQQRRGQLLFDDATICYQHWQSCASCHPDARADALNWDLMNDGVGNPKNSKSMLFSHVTPPSMAKGVRATAEIAVRAGITHILFSHRPEEEAVAIDAYLKTLTPVPSPYLVDGQLSAAAERGRQLFESAEVNCRRCHPPPLYTDLKMHSVGKPESSRFDNQFDTPSLIEVWRTAPYLHNGRYRTIREVLIDARHGLGRGQLDALREQDIQDLVEFVLSL
ncbi:MAG: cell surface protein [Planctomycetaceae bacterium]|nr:cell surface protein [Planctomycetaceae bacterium]